MHASVETLRDSDKLPGDVGQFVTKQAVFISTEKVNMGNIGHFGAFPPLGS